MSEGGNDRKLQELDILRRVTSKHSSPLHVMRMLDHFDVDGPNGTHRCLVLELLGPSIPDVRETRFRDGRLPGHVAKAVAKQALLGLDILHDQEIAHGGESSVQVSFE